MYKDVKKKLLSVALCICMIIGAVQIVPRAKAASETEKTITATLDGGGNRNIKVKYNLPDGPVYDGQLHEPTLISVVDVTESDNEINILDCVLTTNAEPRDAGTYNVFLSDPTGKYIFPQTSIGTYSIEKATIKSFDFAWEGEALALKDSTKGVVPTFSKAQLILSDNITKINLTKDQYTVDPIHDVGAQTCNIHINDSVKKNFNNSSADPLYNPTVSNCIVAYDLSGNDQYYVAFKKSETDAAEEGESEYTGSPISPELGIYQKNVVPSVSDKAVGLDKFNIIYKKSGSSDPGAPTVKDAGSYDVFVSPKNEVVVIGETYFTGTFQGKYTVTGKSADNLKVFVKNPDGGENINLNPKNSTNSKLVLDYNNGNEVIPEVVTVQDENGKSVNCTFSYENATGVGTAYIIVYPDAASNYAGSLKLAYSIASELEFGTIAFEGYADNTLDLYYTKRQQFPKILEVKNKAGVTLTKGETGHYVITYNYQDNNGNWQATELSESQANSDLHMLASGKKRITVHGRGIYAGQSQSIIYTISKVKFEDHASWFTLKVTDAGPFYYNGQEHKPAVEVTYKNNYGANDILDSNDISVSYQNNTNVGSGRITVTATKNSNFSGTMTTDFTILPIDLADVVVEGTTGTSYTYDRTPIHPKFVINGGTYGNSFRYELEENSDYEIVNEDGSEFTGTLPSDCGTYSIWIATKNRNITNGNALPVKRTYQITQADLDSIGFTLDGVTDGKIEWLGKDTKPAVISALKEGIDYKCTYTDCGKVGTATVKIEAVADGNYTGTKKMSYKIEPRSLGNRNIDVSTSVTPVAGNQFKVDISVTDNGEDVNKPDLEKDTDYEIQEIKYLTPTDAPYLPSPSAIGALQRAGEYEITLSGKTNYGGTKKIRVGCGKDISTARISLGVTNLAYTYTTKSLTPAAISLQLETGGTASLAAGDFTVEYTRKDGTAPEQATINAGDVYVTATGNPARGYFGTTSIGINGEDAYYTIKPLNIKETSSLYEVQVTDPRAVEDSEGNKTFPFANEPIYPSVTVSKSALNIYGDLPAELTDAECEITYGISGDACIDAKSHAVIVKGIGNYTGTISTSYIITPLSITGSGIKPTWDSPANYADGVPRLTLCLNGAYDLVEGKDYEKGIIWRQEPGSNWDNICVYKVTGINNFSGEKEFTFKKTQTVFKQAADNENPGEGEVFISNWIMSELLIDPTNPVKVTPSAFTLSFKTKDGNIRNLVKDKDYRITDYGTNISPGTNGNSVTVEGIGEFAGTLRFPLTLYTDIEKASFVTAVSGGAVNGSILYDGAKISVNRLTEAIEAGELSELVTLRGLWPEEGATIGTENYVVKLPNGYKPQMGNVTITIEGTQKEPRYYAGVKTITIRVTGELDSDQFKVTIGNNNVVLYEGKVVTPGGVTYSVYNVTGDQKRLLKGIDEAAYLADPSAYADYDYTISFTDNTGIGLAQALITGINDYSGYITQPFMISYPLSDLTVQVLDANNHWETYNGGMEYTYHIDTDQNKPAVRLYYTAKGAITDFSKWELVDSSLYTLVYDGFERAGDAKILIGGTENENLKGILSGNGKTVNYKLKPISLSGDDSLVTLTMEYTPMFTGNAITANDGLNLKLTYRDNGYELVEGVDYRVQYERNVNASTVDSQGMVYINGMGNFTGSRSESFRILNMSLSSASDISVDVQSVIYTGEPEKPQLKLSQVSGRPRTLIEGVDYKIKEYWDGANIHNTTTPFSQVGNYYVIVEGMGNYTGLREISYTIEERSMNDGVEVQFIESDHCKVVNGVPTCTYDGTVHEPAVRVIFNGVQLKGPAETLSPDYTLNYDQNLNAGIATVTITGNQSFSGSRTIEFRIQPRDIGGEEIRYRDGQNNEFVDGVNYPFTNNSIEPSIAVYDRGMTGVPELVKGIDYEITFTDDNGDDNEHRYAGEVTMTITGTGNYGGTKVFTYYIGEDISKAYTLINGQSSKAVEYNGLVQAPADNEISVVGAPGMPDLINPNGEKRYDIAYYKDGFSKANQVTRDQIVNAGTYYVAVIGVPSKGTFAKSDRNNSCSFTITPRSIAPSYILVSGFDGTYYYTGQPIQPKGILVEDTDLPVTTDVNDPLRRSVKLTNGIDYSLSYTNNISAGKASIVVTGNGNYTGSRVAYFNIVSSNASGNNTWDGSSEGTGSISDGTTTISASDIILGYDNSSNDCMMYNGYARIPTVTIAGKNNNDFIITASNNIQPGIATLMITGRGTNFTGTIIKTYKIKADLSAYGSIVNIADQVYSGYQITPSVTLTCGGNLLNPGKDYTVTYLNNVNVGRATVMVTATSDSYYTGTATGYFNISNTAGGMEISGYGSAYTYTGYPIAPDVVVSMNGRVLNRGTDYTVTYSNNTNVGTASLTVRGIGSYSGTKTITYAIEAKNIENCLTTSVTNYQYTGNTYTPSVTITDSSNGKTLVAGTDYTITYSNNTNPGTASITVTALSKNYTGSKVIPFKITSAAVSGLRTSAIKNNSVKLAWSKQEYADGYQICNSNNRVVATTNKNSYTISGLNSCTTYKFKVRSYVENADGSVSYGNFSTAVSAKTLLNTPKLTAKSTSKGKVTLTWTKVSKASGYEIFYSTKKDGIYTRLKTISKASTRKYVDSGLASGEKYYYTIRAYRTANGVKTYSNYNTIKSVKVK